MNLKLLWQRVLDSGWGILILGAAAIGMGAPQVVDNLRFVETAKQTTGVIVEVVRVGDDFHPIVEYADAEERQLRFESRWTVEDGSYFQVGQTVGVLYAPDDPADARLDTWESWAMDSIIPGLGAVILLIGIVSLVKERGHRPSRNRPMSTRVESKQR